MRLTFLGSSHGIRAVKTFTKNGILAYPRIKRFNSTDYTLDFSPDGLREKAKIINAHAGQGECLIKGVAIRQLHDESRAGMVDKEAHTQNLTLDVDGIVVPNTAVKPPLDQDNLRMFAEAIVSHLPEPFRTVSYVAHASSSMGMKGDKISMHLDFWLTEPQPPRALKEYVIYLNHSIPLFERHLSLSATGTALSFPLDRSVVDNSHIIYLGAPDFQDGIIDPIPNSTHRTFLVEKGAIAVDLNDEIREHAHTQRNHALNKEAITALRTLEGLPKRTEKTQSVTIDGRNVHVVTNPESCHMAFAADNGNWVAYNVNGGDSAAYYVVKHRPQVVYNFKGEPNFLFEQADPTTFQWHMDTFFGQKEDTGEEVEENEDNYMPLVLRDNATNA